MGLTLCFAIIVHAIVVLGVSFAPEDPSDPKYQPLEVILVQSRSEDEPEEADFLSQANQEGGGESDEKERPATPLTAPLPEQKAEIATPAASPATPTPPVEPSIEEQLIADPTPLDQPQEESAETAAPQEVKEMVAEAPAGELPLPEPEAKAATTPAETPEPEVTEAPPEPQTPSAATLISRSLAMASLSAEIERRLDAKANRPRRKFVSASTKEYKYAAYMEAWRQKVERVGNLNYPDEARREHLSGSLILDVALNPDGSVNEMTIRKSSGFKVLDDAAVRIVKLAAPFAPFPQEISGEVDILHVTRTWQFLHDYKFASK